MNNGGLKPKPGTWTVIDVMERLLHAGPDAHLYIHFQIGGKNYEMNLADVKVADLGGLPSHVMFYGENAKLDEPVVIHKEGSDVEGG